MKIVDLSRDLYHRAPSYPGHPPVMHGVWKTHEESLAESGNVHGLASMFISMVDHAGTHIDAPRHFGIVMLLNLGIGLLTPPVGTTLFVGCAIGKVSVDEVMRGIWPFYYVMFTVLMIVTYVPWLSLALPRMFGF